MSRYRSLTLFLTGIIITIILAGCATSQVENPDTVAAAVEATLTAVAANNAPPANDQPPATPADNPPTAVAPKVVLPPLVNGFDPAPRPASSKGDPNAPVVIYEWSDYT